MRGSNVIVLMSDEHTRSVMGAYAAGNRPAPAPHRTEHWCGSPHRTAVNSSGARTRTRDQLVQDRVGQRACRGPVLEPRRQRRADLGRQREGEDGG